MNGNHLLQHYRSFFLLQHICFPLYKACCSLPICIALMNYKISHMNLERPFNSFNIYFSFPLRNFWCYTFFFSFTEHCWFMVHHKNGNSTCTGFVRGNVKNFYGTTITINYNVYWYDAALSRRSTSILTLEVRFLFDSSFGLK